MNHTQQSDEDIFAAVKRNDKKAFTLLYDRYWELVYKKAFSYLHDTDTCMGIVNDIFVNIWEKRDALKIITFKNYLTSSARYRVYNAIKASNTSPVKYVADYEKLDDLSVVYNQAETSFEVNELSTDLDKLLDKLPSRCKEIFLLSRVNQLSNTEIAERLSISKRAVENQISLAVKHLKPAFKHYPAVILVVKLILLQAQMRL
ncbi:sigma-70 family RNA polymerase sigma factor [Mucilaginibacter gossypii]|uniref:RNA polymerase sigma factor n=1 Tax=Mucilaginibacter gossypii TaxID=551996 RepID=UPI000DCEA54F|nr:MULTISPECIES: sigma-70 family RNA polymerase sigma factor [Mucilaginibacter]QTE38579.1 sigma-70 family RNA polymerase sigma factor [Mucilaginibacter gossypii]RAV52860.1 RNA polymerase sigma-70 factor [Mucilaginibacter rubeus]